MSLRVCLASSNILLRYMTYFLLGPHLHKIGGPIFMIEGNMMCYCMMNNMLTPNAIAKTTF